MAFKNIQLRVHKEEAKTSDAAKPYHPKNVLTKPWRKLDDDKYFRCFGYVSSHGVMDWLKQQELPVHERKDFIPSNCKCKTRNGKRPRAKADWCEPCVLHLSRDKPPAKVFERGTALHALILEPPKVAEQIIRERCTHLSEADLAHCYSWADSFRADEQCMAHLEGTQKEIAIFYRGRGMQIRGKADAVNRELRTIYDVKTASDLDSFPSSIKAFKYPVQACFYLTLASLADKKAYRKFLWLVVEKKNGKTGIWECSHDDLVDADRDIDRYFQARGGNWPRFFSRGFPEGYE